jgi:CHASE2 domain-containing sensor protein
MPKKLLAWLYASLRSPTYRIAFISAVFGLVLIWFFPFEFSSYDFSYKFKPHETITNAVLVKIDDHSLEQLGREGDHRLSRTNYARLINVLNHENARLIFLDATFTDSNSVPAVDESLSRALHSRTNAFLPCDFVEEKDAGGVGVQYSPVPPIPVLANDAAVVWGHAEVFGDVIRTISDEYKGIPYVVQLAAEKLNSKVTKPGPNEVRWLHYYGNPTNSIPSCTVQDAILNNFPRGFFDGKIVVVGQDFGAETIDHKQDAFGTPYSTQAAGAFFHATALLNLTRGDWLREIPLPIQFLIIVVWAIASTVLLRAFSGSSKTIQLLIGIVEIAALAVVSWHFQWHLHRWWPWIGPALAQTPLTVLLSLRIPKPDPYIAFISYRTEEDGSTALLIKKSLAEHGLKVFLDVHSLHTGKFDEQLLNEIDSATFFILLLSPNSLARCVNPDDWVLRELNHALAKKKTIIPVLKSGFRFDAKESVPDLPQIAELAKFHGVTFATKDFDGFINQLESLLMGRKHK